MNTRQLILTTILLTAFHLTAIPQTGPSAGWSRVQSDNGEFSIEVPDEFSYFFDSEGFIVGEDQKDYSVREMNLLNAYRDKTLVSFEIYRASADAMSALLKTTLDRGVEHRKTTFRGIEVREVLRTEDKNLNRAEKFYFVSRYFKSKEFVYVVTALSREGETLTMTRFFESMKFTPGAGNLLPGVRRLGELKVSPVEVKVVDPPPKPDKNTAVTPKPPLPNPDSKPVLIASKPRASYVKKARDNNVTGAVRLRLRLTEKGYIPNIDVVRVLPDGLVRQSIFAALRLKFLPAEKGGLPVPIGRSLEYTFSIY